MGFNSGFKGLRRTHVGCTEPPSSSQNDYMKIMLILTIFKCRSNYKVVWSELCVPDLGAGRWAVNITPRPFYPRETTPVPTEW